jgi:hypothetical protein
MHQENQRSTSATSAAPASQPAPVERAGGLRSRLHGLDFASQSAMLAPSAAGRPVASPSAHAPPAPTTASQGAEAAARTTDARRDDEGSAVAVDPATVTAYLRNRFKAEIQAEGLYERVFDLVVTATPKDAPAAGDAERTLEGLWATVSSALRANAGDVRAFKTGGTVATSRPAHGMQPARAGSLDVSVRLDRRGVTREEDAEIQRGLTRCAKGHCRGEVELLAPETYQAFVNFYAAIPAEFRKIDPDVGKITSGFRSYPAQEFLFSRKVASIKASNPRIGQAEAERQARVWVAKPGSSAHNTGHAIDIWMGWSATAANANAMTSGRGALFNRHGPFYRWCQENAPKFGFLPYAVEPWHWEKWL